MTEGEFIRQVHAAFGRAVLNNTSGTVEVLTGSWTHATHVFTILSYRDGSYQLSEGMTPLVRGTLFDLYKLLVHYNIVSVR